MEETSAKSERPEQPATTPRRWSFGTAAFDERAMQLFVRGRAVGLELKPLEVLRYLLQRPGEAVGKEDLIKAVWAGRIISDSALTSTIAKLREALGEEQNAIRTVHGFGYRLDTEVRADGGTGRDEGGPGSRSSRRQAATARRPMHRTVAVLAGVAVVVVAAGIWPLGFWAEPAGAKSVAVLPFANLSAEKDSVYFADGVHDTVITHLARVKDLTTISRTSVMQYRDVKRDLGEIGNELGVAHIVEGTVQRVGDRVRVTAQLIKVVDDQHLWAETFDRDVTDVFGIQSDIAQKVAASVHAQLTPAEKTILARRPTTSVKAYDLYLRARKFVTDPVTTEAADRQGLALVNQAIVEDPDFALAHALAGTFYNRLHSRYRDRTAVDLASQAAERSLALQPDLAEGHVALGYFLYSGRGDLEGALAELGRARQLAPGNSDAAKLRTWILRRQGRWAEALSEIEQAALVDPRDAESVFYYAHTLASLRRYSEAVRVWDRAITLDLWPDLSRLAKAEIAFEITGDLGEWVDTVAGLRPELVGEYTGYVYNLRYFQRDFEAAARTALESSEPYLVARNGRIPCASLAAIAYMVGGNAGQAAAQARRATPYLREQLEQDPNLALARLFLAYAHLAEGRQQSAMAEARRALEQARADKDAMNWGWFVDYASRFFAHAGDHDLALQLLGEALELPFGSARAAQHEAMFDGLRDDPRFRKLIAEHLPKPGA
jgi:TolB-like protein/DNA-binding winged helix-turn-helix (wHTH) protein/Tfp pilus assembly protein PilF